MMHITQFGDEHLMNNEDEQTQFGGAHHPIWWCTSHCLVVHITQFGGAQWCTSPSLVVHITLFGGEHRPVWW